LGSPEPPVRFPRPTRDLTTSSIITVMGNSNIAIGIVVIAIIAFAVIKAINNDDDGDTPK